MGVLRLVAEAVVVAVGLDVDVKGDFLFVDEYRGTRFGAVQTWPKTEDQRTATRRRCLVHDVLTSVALKADLIAGGNRKPSKEGVGPAPAGTLSSWPEEMIVNSSGATWRTTRIRIVPASVPGPRRVRQRTITPSKGAARSRPGRASCTARQPREDFPLVHSVLLSGSVARALPSVTAALLCCAAHPLPAKTAARRMRKRIGA